MNDGITDVTIRVFFISIDIILARETARIQKMRNPSNVICMTDWKNNIIIFNDIISIINNIKIRLNYVNPGCQNNIIT